MRKFFQNISVLFVSLIFSSQILAVENPDDYISLHTGFSAKYSINDPACVDDPNTVVVETLNNPACFVLKTNFQEKYNVDDPLAACQIDLRDNDMCVFSTRDNDDRVNIFYGGGSGLTIKKFKFFMPPGSNHVFWQSFIRTGTTAFAAVSMDKPPEVPASIFNNTQQILNGKFAINAALANGSISSIESGNRIDQLFIDFPVPFATRTAVVGKAMIGEDAAGKQSIAYPIGEGGFFDLAASIVPALTDEERDEYFSNGRWVFIHIYNNPDGELFQWGFSTDAQESLYVPWYQCMAREGLFDLVTGEPNDEAGICQQCIDPNGDECRDAKDNLSGGNNSEGKLSQPDARNFRVVQEDNKLIFTWSYIDGNEPNFGSFLIMRDNNSVSGNNGDKVEIITKPDGIIEYKFEDTIAAPTPSLKYQITAIDDDDPSNNSQSLTGFVPFEVPKGLSVSPQSTIEFNMQKDSGELSISGGAPFPDLDYSYVVTNDNESFSFVVEVSSEGSDWLKLYEDADKTKIHKVEDTLSGQKSVFNLPGQHVDIYPGIDVDKLKNTKPDDETNTIRATITFTDTTGDATTAPITRVIIVNVIDSDASPLTLTGNDAGNQVLSVKGLQSVFGEANILSEIRKINTGENTDIQGLYLFMDFASQVMLSGIEGSYQIGSISIELDAELGGSVGYMNGYQIEDSLVDLNPDLDSRSLDVLFASELSVGDQPLEETETTEISINAANISQKITIRASIDAAALPPVEAGEKYNIYGWVNAPGASEIFESVNGFPLSSDNILCADEDVDADMCLNGYAHIEHPLYQTEMVAERHVITLFDNTFEALDDGTYRFYVAIKKANNDIFHYQLVSTVVVNREE